AARLLWQLDPLPGEARAARLLVIDSYLAERQGVTAFHAMLRFDQDYRPLDRGIAGHFVARLLDLGLDNEAVNWLAALDNDGALKLRLRVRTGLLEPEAAIAGARAQLGKGGDATYWLVLADAADKQGDGTLRVEALERLHNVDPGPAQATALWQAYFSEARSAANRHRLLTGDDAAWLDLAARLLGASPPQSRALFAHISRHAAARETRRGAGSQLVLSLQQSGLDRAALLLVGGEPALTGILDPQARYVLGRMAESTSAPALAARFWQGLPAPADMGAEEWQLRLAAVQWRSGMREPALDTARATLEQTKALPGPAVSRGMALAREMADAGDFGAAAQLYAALLPHAGSGRDRDILFALGEIAESAGRSAAAADYFMRSALAAGGPAGAAAAAPARLAAARNLARAGYHADARAQFQWILKNSGDSMQLEQARRALARLPQTGKSLEE
ncbi:MAG TPA: hypothetical protein VMN03_05505, partial [Burkholderiales bacterium]|nr:hypothetical protein [Burkholderiales bacterium]